MLKPVKRRRDRVWRYLAVQFLDNLNDDVNIVPKSVENVQRQSRGKSVIISLTGAITWFLKILKSSLLSSNLEKKLDTAVSKDLESSCEVTATTI